jgi:hypothetical protein
MTHAPSMPVGIQSAIVASQASHAAHHAAIHAAVHYGLHTYRNAALLELADRFVGYMPEHIAFAIGLPSKTRLVRINAESQRHAIEQRQIVRQIDAELVASRIAEAFADVRYLVKERRDQRVYELVGYVASSDRWLVLPTKLVNGQDGENELWIRTAFPFGKDKVRKAVASGRLTSLA